MVKWIANFTSQRKTLPFSINGRKLNGAKRFYGMGTYLNPGNSGFSRIVKSDYVDKTGLIGVLNRTIDTAKNLTCVSRPRRFGKSYAAQMLCAYYDNTCDSHGLFAKYKISKDGSYEKNINQYHVVNLDVTSFVSEARKEGIPLQEVPARISAAVRNDVEGQHGELDKGLTLNDRELP